MTDLNRELDALARAPALLVAADFDGTLAPIVPQPWMARADPAAVRALRALAELPRTHVAIISGRSLADLAAQLPGAGWAQLVGSHGGEFAGGPPPPLPADRAALLAEVAAAARGVVQNTPGALLEEKPAGVAFHYRNSPDPAAAAAVKGLLAAVDGLPGVRVRHGKMVVELSVAHADKGQAVGRLRAAVAASAVLFVGDDLTDEDAFRALAGRDLGIKVGPGDTAARARVDGPPAVAAALAALAARRAAWLAPAAASQLPATR